MYFNTSNSSDKQITEMDTQRELWKDYIDETIFTNTKNRNWIRSKEGGQGQRI